MKTMRTRRKHRMLGAARRKCITQNQSRLGQGATLLLLTALMACAAASPASAAPQQASPPVPVPYNVPEYVVQKNLPNGVDWYSVDSADVEKVFPNNELGQQLDAHAPYHFSDAHPDLTWSHEVAIDNFDRVPGDDTFSSRGYTFFVGKILEKAPVNLETDPVLGPASDTYSITNTVTKTHNVFQGWTTGGSVDFGYQSPGGGGSVGPTWTYSKMDNDGTSYQTSSSQQAEFDVPANKWGAIQIRKAGGEYIGYVVSWDSSASRWDLSPAEYFVKAPGVDYAGTWNQVILNPTTRQILSVGPAVPLADTKPAGGNQR
ncbi:hypothetical protein [Nocardia terpenica]|nr:hypothetical protein [Nocardia terpenica]